MDVRLWVDADAASIGDGPVIFYWHGTGSSPNEALVLGSVIDEVTAQGGLVAAFDSYSRTCTGCTTTGNNVWFYEDFAVADEVLACAIEQVGIDTRHIHTTGMSAGGLQATAMTYARSDYLASVAPMSGGIIGFFTNTTWQDPSNHVAAMIIHGGVDDNFGISFMDASVAFYDDITADGSFAFLCDHGGGHVIPSGIATPMWQFFQDHPYKRSPSPYVSSLPGSFPGYCTLSPP